MHAASIAVAVALLTVTSTAGAQQADVMAPVRQFVDAFNKGDTLTVAGACAEQTSIIDEFPPYEWHGARACLKWMSDYDTDARKNGITDGMVTLDTPRHIDVTEDRAYVVIPSNYAYTRKGKPEKEIGSMFTFALEKSDAGWRITGWAWAKN